MTSNLDLLSDAACHLTSVNGHPEYFSELDALGPGGSHDVSDVASRQSIHFNTTSDGSSSMATGDADHVYSGNEYNFSMDTVDLSSYFLPQTVGTEYPLPYGFWVPGIDPQSMLEQQ